MDVLAWDSEIEGNRPGRKISSAHSWCRPRSAVQIGSQPADGPMLRDVAAATLMPTTKERRYLVGLLNLDLVIGALLPSRATCRGGLVSQSPLSWRVSCRGFRQNRARRARRSDR